LLASAITLRLIYVVFGKTNSSAINLSAIANANNPTGGFVIYCWLYQTQHKIFLSVFYHLVQLDKHPQSNHPSHHR
jgi:hypothetical protein